MSLDLMPLSNFLEKYSLDQFSSETRAIQWIRRTLKPNSLLRIGTGYFVSESEMLTLLASVTEKKMERKRKNRVHQRNVKLHQVKSSEKGTKFNLPRKAPVEKI